MELRIQSLSRCAPLEPVGIRSGFVRGPSLRKPLARSRQLCRLGPAVPLLGGSDSGSDTDGRGWNGLGSRVRGSEGFCENSGVPGPPLPARFARLSWAFRRLSFSRCRLATVFRCLAISHSPFGYRRVLNCRRGNSVTASVVIPSLTPGPFASQKRAAGAVRRARRSA
jgi:hypothetical protein